MTFLRLVLGTAAAFCAVSCSLDYGSEEAAETQVIPEYSFTQADFMQYEDGQLSLSMTAAGMEQYRDDDALYGCDISFFVYDEDGSVSADGACGLISADTNTDSYTLSGGIRINGYEEELTFAGEKLRWNGSTEQLAGGSGDTVSITQEGDSRVVVTGRGFAASGISRTYAFSGAVSGTIETAESADEAHD